MDWYLLITPLLALAVVLLLGFTGCDVVLGLPPVQHPIPLVLRVRVPAGLTVLMSTATEFRSGFRWRVGSSTVWSEAAMPTSRMDGTDTLVEFQIPDAEMEGWQVECTLLVKEEGTTRVSATGLGEFMVEKPATSGTGYAAVFTAAGRPSTPVQDPFRIEFTPGRIPE
jgi:hypothetical protein